MRTLMNENSLSLLSLLSPLCRVFTIIYLKQTMFLGCVVLQLFCIYNFMLHVMLLGMFHVLYLYIITSCSLCAVPNMAVFCSSLISCFPGVLLRYCLNDFEMASVACVITGLSSSLSTSDQNSLNSVRTQLDNMAVSGMTCALIHPQSADTGFSLWSVGFKCMSDLLWTKQHPSRFLWFSSIFPPLIIIPPLLHTYLPLCDSPE
jgi:hypothetical protein